MKEKMYCYAGDLCGFRNIIENLNLTGQSRRVKEWKNLVRDGVNKFDLPKCVLVSDTIYAGAEKNELGLEKLIGFARLLLEKGITKSFPLRGAISSGDICWDKQIPFGKALLDAFKLTNEQDWFGTTCDLKIDIHEDLWKFDTLFVYPTPMKNGSLVMYPVVSWNVPPIEKLEMLTALKGLAKPKEGWNWDLMKKVQNTAQFSIFLKLVKAGFIKQIGEKGEIQNAIPERFPGLTPLEPIEHYINFLLENSDSSEL